MYEVIRKSGEGAALPRPEKSAGELTAIVSVFGVEDSQGEIVDAGSFAKTIAERGQVRPVIWSHDHWGVASIIGRTTSLEETTLEDGRHGLVARWVPLDTEPARAVVEMLDAGAITDYSFSAAVKDYRRDPDSDTRHLTELDLIEVGPCLRGANPQASHLGRAAVPDPEDQTPPAEEPEGDEVSATDEVLVARARLARLALDQIN